MKISWQRPLLTTSECISRVKRRSKIRKSSLANFQLSIALRSVHKVCLSCRSSGRRRRKNTIKGGNRVESRKESRREIENGGSRLLDYRGLFREETFAECNVDAQDLAINCEATRWKRFDFALVRACFCHRYRDVTITCVKLCLQDTLLVSRWKHVVVKLLWTLTDNTTRGKQNIYSTT